MSFVSLLVALVLIALTTALLALQDGPQAEMANYDATEAALGAPGFRQSFSRMNLSLNQQKLYDDSRDAVWFTWLLPAEYHTRCPQGSDRVAILPFALDTETWRPTGSVNFSRIDTVMLLLVSSVLGCSSCLSCPFPVAVLLTFLLLLKIIGVRCACRAASAKRTVHRVWAQLQHPKVCVWNGR